jgi:hypothetical protein
MFPAYPETPHANPEATQHCPLETVVSANHISRNACLAEIIVIDESIPGRV